MNQIRKANVLVVDDDAFNCRLLNRILTAEGYTPRSVNGGQEALEAVAEQLPDLILLDVMMPGMDGFEVARRLRADPRSSSVPIIMVTALSDSESRRKSFEAGANEFITKPIKLPELQALTGKFLNV